MKIQTAEFVASVGPDSPLPDPRLPQVSLVGRSNVGKSTLINALARRRIARAGGAPGTTRLLNVYRLVLAGGRGELLLIDLPGYGYARGGTASTRVFDRLTERHFSRAPGPPARPPLSPDTATAPAPRRVQAEHRGTARRSGTATAPAPRGVQAERRGTARRSGHAAPPAPSRPEPRRARHDAPPPRGEARPPERRAPAAPRSAGHDTPLPHGEARRPAPRAPAGAILLVDARHPGLENDRNAAGWLTGLNLPFVVAATKLDRLARSARLAKLQAHEQALARPVLPISAKRGDGLPALWTALLALAEGTPTASGRHG